MRVAIIGAGLQCMRRAPVIKESAGDNLVVIASPNADHASKAASRFGCESASNWKSVVERSDIDAVIVATPPHVHAEISIAAMRSGKHVLCEKPLSRTVHEASEMVRASKETGKTLKCGFNHRHHPAIWAAKQHLDQGDLGRPLFARSRYGICGRPGYEKEWRADPSQAAGGQFIEQGSHVIDLFRWFLGEIRETSCMTSRLFFTEQTLDGAGMALFRAESGATASLHTTLTQWKNLFSFEVFGTDGYVQVESLGGAYGTERLTFGRRDFTAPFNDHVTEYRGGDPSWKEEWKEFASAVEAGREPLGNGLDGLEAMRLALGAYEAERKAQTLTLPPLS